MSDALTPAEVRRIAGLARLDIAEDEVEPCRARLSAVLGYVDRLRQVDLAGVEPMTHVIDPSPDGRTNRLDDDRPGPTLPAELVASMSPRHEGPFVRVPRVLGESSS